MTVAFTPVFCFLSVLLLQKLNAVHSSRRRTGSTSRDGKNLALALDTVKDAGIVYRDILLRDDFDDFLRDHAARQRGYVVEFCASRSGSIVSSSAYLFYVPQTEMDSLMTMTYSS